VPRARYLRQYYMPAATVSRDPSSFIVERLGAEERLQYHHLICLAHHRNYLTFLPILSERGI
jgi:hypothetical protein